MSGGKVHIVTAGNPTVSSGAFYDAFHDNRGLWNCITLDVFDTPNLRGLTIEDLLKMDPQPGGPLDQNPIPYLATRRWVRDMYLLWWHGDEASSPSWMSRVRGRFPSQDNNALFRLAWLERSKERALRDGVRDDGEHVLAGVDVGGGDAETVAYLCQVAPTRKKILKFGAWRAQDTLGDVARFLDPYLKRLTRVRVDAVGIGHNFGLYLRKKGFPVDLINVGLPCENRSHLNENNPAARFANHKAQYYQNLADAFQRDEVDGLVDEVTIGQLAGILYEVDARGRIKIEPKERAAARGVASPDRAEALMLALGETSRLYEFMSGKEIEQRISSPGLGKQQRIDAAEDAANDRRRLSGFRDWGPKGHAW